QHRAYGAVADLLRRALAISPSAPTEIAHRMISETLPGIEPEAAKLVLAALGYGLTLPPLSGDTKRKLLDRAVRDLILRVARSQRRGGSPRRVSASSATARDRSRM